MKAPNLLIGLSHLFGDVLNHRLDLRGLFRILYVLLDQLFDLGDDFLESRLSMTSRPSLVMPAAARGGKQHKRQ